MSTRKVIVAVDPFATDRMLLERAIAESLQMFEGKDYTFEPVYVMTPQMISVMAILDQGLDGIRDSIVETMTQRLEKIRETDPRLGQPVVEFAPYTSTRGQVATLLEYAQKAACDYLVVSSHSRTGMKRIFLGSFAEALTAYSPIPVLVLNPRQSASATDAGTLLFPTDLSDVSRLGLEQLIQAMGALCKKVILFHQFETFLFLELPPFAALPIPNSALEREQEKKKEVGRRWAEEFKQRGVDAEIQFEVGQMTVADGILNAAKEKKASGIAMVSETGPVESVLLGSITRQVMRRSSVPVWVIHKRPSPKAEAIPTSAFFSSAPMGV